ncbi:MAG: aminoacyl-tRNA hydrolase [Acidobacteria bacterium]|nr:aminoacyl-tRNA hydrolase [Acidobacteriota bacterium]
MAETRDTQAGTPERIVLGLGNPGASYARNRHNVGFMVLDALARKSGARWSERGVARTCRTEIGGRRVLLAEPLTYMNRSGRAARMLLEALGLGPGDLIVVLDDLSLPLGRLRVRARGSAGGHHGLESVLELAGTDDIVRVRLGIAEERMPEDKAGFVLSDFSAGQAAELEEMISKAGNAVKSILSEGVARTMALYNA